MGHTAVAWTVFRAILQSLTQLSLYIALLLPIYSSKHDHSETIPGIRLPTTLLDSIGAYINLYSSGNTPHPHSIHSFILANETRHQKCPPPQPRPHPLPPPAAGTSPFTTPPVVSPAEATTAPSCPLAAALPPSKKPTPAATTTAWRRSSLLTTWSPAFFPTALATATSFAMPCRMPPRRLV